MEIKFLPGKTLLTLSRLAIYGLASLSVLGMHNFADTALNSGISLLEETSKDTSAISGSSYTLYYDQKIEGTQGINSIYKLYYISGQEGQLGLVDAAGKVILEPQYEDIIVLPYTYILKIDGLWAFYDQATITALNDHRWDSVEISQDESGKIIDNTIKVEKAGLFGTTDQNGNIIVEPK